MKIIYKERNGGKTTELIKLSHETKHYIVCSKHDEAICLFNEAKEMGYDIPQPITYYEFVNGKYGEFVGGFLIDNVECLLEYISKVPITAITLTKNEGLNLRELGKKFDDALKKETKESLGKWLNEQREEK